MGATASVFVLGQQQNMTTITRPQMLQVDEPPPGYTRAIPDMPTTSLLFKPITNNAESSNQAQITSLNINKTEELIAKRTGDLSRVCCFISKNK